MSALTERDDIQHAEGPRTVRRDGEAASEFLQQAGLRAHLRGHGNASLLKRFVLLYRGPTPPEADLCRIRELSGSDILRQEDPRLLLVEADEKPLRDLVGTLENWVVSEETVIPPPAPHERHLKD